MLIEFVIREQWDSEIKKIAYAVHAVSLGLEVQVSSPAFSQEGAFHNFTNAIEETHSDAISELFSRTESLLSDVESQGRSLAAIEAAAADLAEVTE